jgi:RTX calcium-binding nonapeptide repeat (4 copies)
MRANTKKHGMGKRFAIVIGVAAVGVMALGAQTAAPAQAIVKYDTKLTITHEAGDPAGWHGRVLTDRKECMGGRRVVLFKREPGADRKLGTDRSFFDPHVWISGTLPDGTPVYGPAGVWGVKPAPLDGRVYARISPKVGDGFVCRADRSRTIIGGKLCFEDPSFCNPPTPAPTPPGQPPPGRCQAATIVGTEGPDQITGTAASDVIAALGGNDTVAALAANDVICGGPGTDVLRGGQGNDTLIGEAGKDVLYGGKGKDICVGDKGAFGCER